MSEPIPITPLLVGEKRACELLGAISARTLFNLRGRGLPFVRLGTRIMYRPADLAAWVDGQLLRQPAAQEASL